MARGEESIEREAIAEPSRQDFDKRALFDMTLNANRLDARNAHTLCACAQHRAELGYHQAAMQLDSLSFVALGEYPFVDRLACLVVAHQNASVLLDVTRTLRLTMAFEIARRRYR